MTKEVENTTKQFETVMAECRSLFEKKLHDYGASWRILRPQSLTDQILIKAKRIRSIEVKGVTMIDEGIRPEFIGIINYGIVGLIQLAKGYSDAVDITNEEAMQLYDNYSEAALQLMLKKNHDYDEAWRLMRISSYTDFILTKIQRTKEIEDLAGATLVSEGVDANYMDMINYAVFGVIKLTNGENEPPQGKSGKPYTIPEEPSSVVSEPHVKYLVEGEKIAITTEIVSILGEDGKTMRTESITDFTRKQIRKRYATLNDFVKNWTEAERKKVIVDELKDYSVLVDAVREKNPALEHADIFDVICHVAFDQPPVTRRERANNVKKRNYFAKYEGKAREVLEALLDKYADYGILNLEDSDILDTAPFNKIGKPQKIVKLFGGLDKFEQALKELENEIYNVA